jgi:hypothetical protein
MIYNSCTFLDCCYNAFSPLQAYFIPTYRNGGVPMSYFFHVLRIMKPLSKGHFTLWPSVKWTKDYSNLIGGEQKFVCLAFTLKTN